MTRQSVQTHINSGTIIKGADGKLNSGDADAMRQMRRVSVKSDGGRAAALLKVRARAAAVKISRLRLLAKNMLAKSVEKAPLEAAAIAHAELVVARIATWPERYVAFLVGEMQIDETQAAIILTEFRDLALVELGDVKNEARQLFANARSRGGNDDR